MSQSNAAPARIESMKFSFPADDPGSLAAFSAITAQLFALEPLAPGAPFFGEAEVYFLPDVVLSFGNSSGSCLRRTAEMILQSEADGILVVAYLAGSVEFETERGTDLIAPGEIVFFDLRQPVSIVAETPENITLIVARRRLEALVPHLHQSHGFVLRSGANRELLTAHLQSMRAVADSISASQARSIGDATVQLVGSCLTEAPRSGARASAAGVSLAQVREAIEQRLEQPELGPQLLMQDLGISRPTLYRLFEPLGGVKAYIQERRLRHAWHVIADPKVTNVRVKQLSYNLGYSHPSAFSRAFRKTFGVSPSEVRKRMLSGDGIDEKPWGLAPEAEPFLDADDG